jgi:hypothetical protein
MAPEQWSADGAVPASDRYAFAAMAYELLSGAPPFAASSVPALMEKHFRAEVPPITGQAAGSGPSLPVAVDAVLRRGLAKDPDARYGTAAELVGALRAALGTRASAPAPAAAGSTANGPPRIGVAPIVAGSAGLAVTAFGIWVVTRDAGSASPGAVPDKPTPGDTAEVLTTPPGATIIADGEEVGVTPKVIDAVADKALALELRKPGYLPVKRTIAAGGVVSISLQPVDEFQGTWAMPTGELRRFVRQGDAVVALRLASASDSGTFYRRFQFVPSTGSTMSFAADEDHVDPRLPDEPSCRVPLKAQYDYDIGGDELELRKERVKLDLVDGKCVIADQGWGDAQPLSRIDRAADAGQWAESRAGGGGPINIQADPAVVANPGFEPKEPLVDDAVPTTTTLDKTPPGTKRRGKTARGGKPRPEPLEIKQQEANLLNQAATANKKDPAAPNSPANVAPPPQQAPAPPPQKQIVPAPKTGASAPEPEGAVGLDQQKAQKSGPRQKN